VATATEVAIRVAYATGIVLALLSMLFLKHVFLLALAFLFIFLAMQESQQLQTGESFEDSFMGYDFSQGYTSLERSQKKEPAPQPSLFQRWMERRRAEKRRRQEVQQQAAEIELDALLAKVHERGIDALTEAEKRQLKRASDRFRSKGSD